MKSVAILAVQGAFAEHRAVFESLGASVVELRKKEDLKKPFNALVLPGGESTVQKKLLLEQDMLLPLKTLILEGLPVFATCAGLILLASAIENDKMRCFETLPVTVRRNAYGRQLGSFRHTGEVKGIGSFTQEFIRAPAITEVEEGVEVLSVTNGSISGVRYKNQTAFAFHPELLGDKRLHSQFLSNYLS